MFYLVKSNTLSISKKIINKIILSNNVFEDNVFVFDYDENRGFDKAYTEYLSLDFSGEPKVIILKNSDFINALKIEKEIEEKIKNSIEIENRNIIIFTVEKINKTGKINKKYGKYFKILEKDAPEKKDKINFIKTFFDNKNVKINGNLCQLILDYVGDDFDLLLTELNKLYIIEENEITKSLIEKSVIDFSRQRLYKITEYVLKLDSNGVKNMIKQLKSEGEGIFLIGDALVREVSKFLRFFLLRERGYSNSEIIELTNWNQWGVRNYSNYIDNWKDSNILSEFFYDIILDGSFMEMLKSNQINKLDTLEKLLTTNIIKIRGKK